MDSDTANHFIELQVRKQKGRQLLKSFYKQILFPMSMFDDDYCYILLCNRYYVIIITATTTTSTYYYEGSLNIYVTISCQT